MTPQRWAPVDPHAAPRRAPQRSPRRAHTTTLAASLAVVVAAAAIGYLAGRGMPHAEVAPSVSTHSTTRTLVPPTQVGQWVRLTSESPRVQVNGSSQTSSGTYARDGKTGFIALFSSPQETVTHFMSDNAVSDVQRVGQALCGHSADANADACGMVVDQIGILIVNVGDLSRSDLGSIAQEFADALAST